MTAPLDPAETLMGAADVQTWLAEHDEIVCRNTVLYRMRTGTLPGRKVGARWVTSLSELRRWYGIVPPQLRDVPTAIPNVTPLFHRKRSA